MIIIIILTKVFLGQPCSWWLAYSARINCEVTFCLEGGGGWTVSLCRSYIPSSPKENPGPHNKKVTFFDSVDS